MHKPGSAPRSSWPIEIDATGNGLLGMSPAKFLRDYWQKRPLLIRNAFPDYETPVMPEDLAGLACEEAVLSRIVMHDKASDGWTVRTGPFAEEAFPGMPHHDWTLLVQDMDKWDPDIRALLDHFDFLPRWRIDDVMISFAAPGGSVGAHVDQYDVFLLQAHGHRRWQIDASEAMGKDRPSAEFREGVELKLLREFHPTHDWVLGPGDMLYLPPNVPHHGVAEDACLTFSVGMRAPSAAELLGDFVDTLLVDADESVRYRDDDLAPPKDPNEIDADAMQRAIAGLNALRMNDPERLGDWFGRFMTLYRSVGDSLTPDPPRSRIEIEFDLQQGALLQRHPWTRVAWRRSAASKTTGKSALAKLYVGGQTHVLPLADARTLAAAETLGGEAYAALSAESQALVLELLAEGHYRLDNEADDSDGEHNDDDF
jgi:50S ribosomal protein L16 3-hydroxylase